MGSTMLVSLVFCLCLGASLAVFPDELRTNFELLEYNTNLDEPKYRLTDSVQPTEVFLDIDVDLEERTIIGSVQIVVQVTEENMTQIVLHQKVVSIEAVSVFNANNQQVGLRFPEPYSTDDYYEIILINFQSALAEGEYTIQIRYTGQINDNPIDRGFYRGYYYYQNQKYYYATTQFQPYHARKAFPCFDEPQFKSRFVIAITRDPDLSPSFSNMAINTADPLANGRIKETFFPTPIISVYLIAFHVSRFVTTNDTSTLTKPFGIASRPGVTDQHPYAADIGLKITNELDDYLGIEYYDMGIDQPMKNDHIALPDFPSGAMENWGMVNYREAYLLYDEQNTNLLNKIFIATIMAHELAHKWFGNLVTCFWWSNLWLNESYASFFEYFAAHWADPSLELDDQFVVDYVHSALNWDAGGNATPMNYSAVADNPSITGHFSTTSYAKGASVLRMLEHFVGPRTFRNALRYYLRDNAYGVGYPEDMYNGFRRATDEDLEFSRLFPTVDVGTVFDNWVQNPGSPVLNVNFNMDTGVIGVSQERFLLTGTPDTQIWHIPITWTQQGSADFTNTRPSLLLTEASTTITANSGHLWVMFNIAQSGLYRVNYDDHNWEMIAAFLRNNNNRQTVHKLNRAQIVNDVLYFLRSEKITIERAFDVLSFLENETDYYVWNGALGQLDWLRSRLIHIPNALIEFDTYLLNLIDTAIRHLGYDESASDSTSTILNRMQIMNLACNLGHEGCIEDSLQKWNRFRENSTNLVPVNMRRYVYCVGLREGDSEDYEFLLNQYNTAENTADMVVILRALACTRDNSTIVDYLRESMYNDRIRIHDKTNAFSFALQGNRENVEIVVDFLKENYEEIRETYGGEARLIIAINAVPAFLTSFAAIQEFQSWAYSQQVALAGAFGNAQSAVTTAMNNLAWGSRMAEEIHGELYERNSAAVFTSSILLMSVTYLVYLVR